MINITQNNWNKYIAGFQIYNDKFWKVSVIQLNTVGNKTYIKFHIIDIIDFTA